MKNISSFSININKNLKTSENKRALEEIDHLASFPKVNPNPVVEVDLSGKILYLNPAAKRLFPDLKRRGDKHPYLANLDSLFSKIKLERDKNFIKEVNVKDLWFQQTLHYVSDMKRILIYGLNISKRKAMEEELIKNEKQLREVIRVTGAGYYNHSTDGSSGLVSDRFAEILGFRPKELPKYPEFSKWLAKRIHKEDSERFRADVHDFHEGRIDRFDHEYRVLAKNGTWLWLHFNSTSLQKDARGFPLYVTGLAFDITERKQIENKIIDSETRYRRLFESAKDGILILDAKTGMIVDVNPFLIQLLGFSRKTFLGKKIWELGFFKDIISNQAKFTELQRKKYIRYENLALETTDGRRINVEFVSNVYQVDHHEVIQCNVRDITDRKIIEEALRESEKKFRAVAETAKDAIISANAKGNIVYFNKGAEQIFGYTIAEVLNKPLSVIMPVRLREDHQQGFSRFLTDNKPHIIGKTIEQFGKNKNGKEFPIELSIATWQSNNKTFFTAIIRDITEHKNLDQRKDDFITIAGHELRTPVSAIRIINQMLQETVADNPKAQEYLSKIAHQIAIQTNLINDLLSVSKIHTGKLEISREQFEMKNLVEETIEDLQRATKTHKILIKGNICGKIFADRERIRQVLVNFCSNAIKFSPKGEKIVVGLKDNQKEVVVGVTDYGIGIPKEHHGRIFDRFYRVYGSGNKSYPGLGMGLYISYQIIKLLNGKIWFESRQGKGSTFYFSLPFEA